MTNQDAVYFLELVMGVLLVVAGGFVALVLVPLAVRAAWRRRRGDYGAPPGWTRVREASDCVPCPCCHDELWCPACETHYFECDCPGPHQEDEYEYREFAGVLYARAIGGGGRDHLTEWDE